MAKKPMPRLSLKPEHISGDPKGIWFYQQRRGIEVVYQFRSSGGDLYHADIFILPWKKVAKAVDQWRRVRRAKERRKA